MIDVVVLLGFISSVVLFLSTPGPVTVMVANNSSKQGFLAGVLTIAGTNAASLVLIAISFLVLYGVLVVSETMLTWFGLFGALYLPYFALQVIKDSFYATSLSLDKAQTNKKLLAVYFKQGFLVGISNPKDVLFFMAFFPLFFGISENISLAMMILTLTWVILDYGILSLYGVIFAKIKIRPLLLGWEEYQG
ncbi:LysE family translocator [Moraxella canis]|uniref:LysE family translocator n=1 Tax=Moraxella canis TaxID=90239 RepID=UPI0009929041|nr:LysE family transporter [Moraxella canis]